MTDLEIMMVIALLFQTIFVITAGFRCIHKFEEQAIECSVGFGYKIGCIPEACKKCGEVRWKLKNG